MDNAVFERRGETTRLGSFEIVRKLARGGMAEIFLARTRGPSGFEKLVVLKKILPKYAGKPRFVQQFLDEAKLAASLDHPNIAQVYDIGMIDGSYFFTMEYLHGQDVRSILHRSWRTGDKLPIENAVQIARNVASALHFAHEKQRGDGALLGIVHRDVSPSNIIVTYDGATKLLDFGVAKTTASTVKTRTGALKGKVSYMSPEQARGAPLDRRSDVFSLGVVLWEMVTVQRLFRGENDLATLQLIINEPPRPPTALRPDCPIELERIALRALAQDPDDRYPTAEHLVNELDELAREHKLKQSSSALSATISQLFGAELGAWREARAAGVALADHLNDISDRTAPVSESDFIQLPSDDDDDDDGEREGLEGQSQDAAQLGDLDPLYDRDIDDEDDDNEKTEHVPLFDEPFPLFGGDPPSVDPGTTPPRTELRTTPMAPLTPAPAVATPRDPLAPVLGTPTTPTAAVGSPATLIGPFPQMPGLEVPPAAAGGTLLGQGPPAGPPTLPNTLPLGALGPGLPPPNAPFAAAPWQSGQPSAPPTERIEKSWAVIDLPAVDPEMFERHRRIVLRVAAGLVGFILLLAIIAGRC